MTGKTHIAGGVLTGMAIAHYLLLSNQCLPIYAGCLVGATLVGSLIPDLDSEKSIISKSLWLLTILYKLVKKIVGLFKIKGMGHRGLFHSLVVPLILGLIGFFLHRTWEWTAYISIGIISGYLSHLILDMLNPMGISLFFPFFKSKFRLLPKCIAMKTGGIAESVIFSIFSTIILVYGFVYINFFLF